MPETKQTANEVLAASPEEIVLVPYDGFDKFARRAADRLDADDERGAATAIDRASEIVSELDSSLDRSSAELSGQLSDVYVWVLGELLDARREGGAGRIREAAEVMRGLREAWAEAAATLRAGQER